MKDFKLSDIHICITPDMEKFLDVMKIIAKNYRVVELNECLKTIGGNLKQSLEETLIMLEFAGVENLATNEKQDNKCDIKFYFEKKDAYICGIIY